MFDAEGLVKQILNELAMWPGDVMYARRGWLRRREWFLLTARDPLTWVCVLSPDKNRAGSEFGSLGSATLCNDPDKWPDDVCAAVVKWRLTDA